MPVSGLGRPKGLGTHTAIRAGLLTLFHRPQLQGGLWAFREQLAEERVSEPLWRGTTGQGSMCLDYKNGGKGLLVKAV